jgi:hypothetical protein
MKASRRFDPTFPVVFARLPPLPAFHPSVTSTGLIPTLLPGGTAMKAAELKSFGKPDEVREFPKGRLELIKVGGAMIGRATFEPGWRWATSVQPIAKTKSCEAPHFQYHVSGVLHVRMDDGSEYECKPGDISLFPSGHDAWTVGNEAVVVVDFQGMVDYAKSL